MVTRHGLPFPVLADDQRAVFSAYDVQTRVQPVVYTGPGATRVDEINAALPLKAELTLIGCQFMG